MHVVTEFWATLAHLEFWRATAQDPRCPRLTGKTLNTRPFSSGLIGTPSGRVTVLINRASS